MGNPPAAKITTWLAYIVSFQLTFLIVFQTWIARNTMYIATTPECLCLYHRHIYTGLTNLSGHLPKILSSFLTRRITIGKPHKPPGPQMLGEASMKRSNKNLRVWAPHALNFTWFMPQMSPHSQSLTCFINKDKHSFNSSLTHICC